MNNRTFLAYSVAGVAAALAITAISASAFAGSDSPSDATSAVEAPAAQGAALDGIEYVYVDAPAGSDDEWEDEEHEGDEAHEHEERGGLLSWLREGEHDDDD